MTYLKSLLMLMLMFTFALGGCFAGNISRRHNPEENKVIDDKYIIHLTLRAPGGNAQKGFPSAEIDFNGDRFSMTRELENAKEVIYVFRAKYDGLRGTTPKYYFIFEAANGKHTYRPPEMTKPVP